MKKLFAIIALLLLPELALAATVYVDGTLVSDCTSGNYSIASRNCTGSDGNAYNTIQEAVDVMSASDLMEIRAGTGYSSPSSNPPSGTALSPTRIRNYGATETTGETVTITGIWPAFYGTSRSYIKLHGRKNGTTRVWTLNANSASEEVLIVDNGDHHMWFEGMILTGALSQGIYLGNQTGSGGSTVRDNEIHTNGDHYQLDHGIYIASSDNLVEYNILRNNACYGLQMYNGSGGVSNNIARYNLIYANGQMANTGGTGTCGGVVIAGGSGNQFYGNIVRDNIINADGLSVYNNATSTLVYNNTFYNNRGATANLLINAGNSGSIVRNNVFSQPTSGSNFVDSQGITKSNNFCTTAGGTTNCSVSGASAGWVDAASGVFSLAAGSSLINAGTATITTGVAACANGASPDIGAIESLAEPTATVDGTALVITLENNCTSTILPASSVTGFSVKRAGSADTISSLSRSGSNSFTGTLADAFTAGQACLFSYSQTGNAFSSNNIGGTTTNDQEILAFTDSSCTNLTGGGGATVNFEHWRFYLLQGGTPNAWIGKCLEDSTDCVVAPGSKLWVLIKLHNQSGSAFPTFNLRPRVRYNGGSYVTITDSYVNGIKMLGTGTQLGTVLTSGTQIATALLTGEASSLFFCIANRSASSIPSVDLGDDTETECAIAVDISTSAVIGDTYEFCPYDDAGNLISCATPAKLTIGSYGAVR